MALQNLLRWDPSVAFLLEADPKKVAPVLKPVAVKVVVAVEVVWALGEEEEEEQEEEQVVTNSCDSFNSISIYTMIQ